MASRPKKQKMAIVPTLTPPTPISQFVRQMFYVLYGHEHTDQHHDEHQLIDFSIGMQKVFEVTFQRTRIRHEVT